MITDENTRTFQELVLGAIDNGNCFTEFANDKNQGADVCLAYDAAQGFMLVVVPFDQEDHLAGAMVANAAVRLCEDVLKALSLDGGETFPYSEALFIERRDYKLDMKEGQPAPRLWHAYDWRFAAGPRRRTDAKGRTRNQPCPCGSGKKHKRCCGRAA